MKCAVTCACSGILLCVLVLAKQVYMLLVLGIGCHTCDSVGSVGSAVLVLTGVGSVQLL